MKTVTLDAHTERSQTAVISRDGEILIELNTIICDTCHRSGENGPLRVGLECPTRRSIDHPLFAVFLQARFLSL